jgi:hypothetical protein
MKQATKVVAIILLALVIPAILSFVFFNFYSMLDVPNDANRMSYPILLVPIAALLILAIFFFTKILKKVSRLWLFFIIALIAIFILQIVVMILTKPIPSFDAAGLIATAFNDQVVGYSFLVNSNNSFLGMIYLVLKDVLSWFFSGDLLPVFMYSIITISLLCVNFSALGITWLAQQLFSKKVAIITFILSVAVLLISPNAFIPYSDTFAMPFAVGIIMLSLIIYRRLKANSQNKLPLTLLIISLAIIATIGYLIKPTVIFALIPILIIGTYYLIKHLDKKTLKNHIGSLVAVTVIIPLFILATKFLPILSTQYIYSTRNIVMPTQTIEDHTATVLHYLSTGTNPNFGYFDSKSANNLYTSNSQDEINRGSIEIISERINQRGVFWYLGLLAEKNIMNLSDGTFFYGEFGGNVDVAAPFGEIKPSGILFEYIYPHGKTYQIYKYFVNSVWLLVLIGIVVSAIINLKARRKILFALQLSVLLLLVFLMFFEARSRYLILFLPIFILLGSFGIAELSARISPILARWRR